MSQEDLFADLMTSSGFFELIEFSLDRRLPDGSLLKGRYGVNVAKVREVVRLPKINPLAARIPALAGIFELRGIAIPAINLRCVLGETNSQPMPNQQIIVAEFSGRRAGFIVDATQRIRRIEWAKILPPSGDSSSYMSGMIIVEPNDFLFVLDLERVVHDLELIAQGSSGHANQAHSAPAFTTKGRGRRILLVDDSDLILSNIGRMLRDAGFHISTATNGAQALDIVTNDPNFDLVLTDIEMPKLDGLSLTAKIKADPRIASIPVVLHTSLSGEATHSAGVSVGANGYVIKNDTQNLVATLTRVLENKSVA